MITHRKDYDGIQPWPTKRQHLVLTSDGEVHGIPYDGMPDGYRPVIADDEPVLLLPATDPLASMVTDFYADLLITAGAEKELVDAVTALAARMRAYRDPDQQVPMIDKGWLRP